MKIDLEKYTVCQLRSCTIQDKDLEDIQELFQTLCPDETPPTANHIKLALPVLSVWIAREKTGAENSLRYDRLFGRIVAMATLSVSPLSLRYHMTGEVRDVVTLESHQQKGLMEEILRELISQAREKNLSFLWLTSRPHRIGAHRLYEKLGFTLMAQATEKGTNLYRLYLN